MMFDFGANVTNDAENAAVSRLLDLLFSLVSLTQQTILETQHISYVCSMAFRTS